MPLLLVRNMQPGPTVFSDVKNDIAIEWQGSGDPNGEDVQQVPGSLVDHPSFLKSLQRGVLQVEETDDPEMVAKLQKQVDAFRNRTAGAAETARASIDPAANNDIITLSCIAENNRGTGQCGNPVPVKEKTKDERPALCSMHQGQENNFIMEETDEMRNGKPGKRWVRATQGYREYQPQ